jgi:L-iditol 2-dehydrogenase
MKAAVFYAPNDLRLEERDIPKPGKNEVLVKVEVSGLCPSDVRIFRNGSSSVKPPITLGHEFAGTVQEIGENVDSVRIEDRITLPADAYCGNCRMCRAGHENVCERNMTFGYNIEGVHADYAIVPNRFVERGGIFQLPSSVGFEEASMTEPLACSLNTIETMGTTPDKTVTVIGDGPMGLLHVGLARVYGASKIILVGLVDWKLKLGQALGATNAVNAKEDSVKRVLELTNGVGSDIVVVTVVKPSTIAQGLQMAARRGRVTIFGGTPKGVMAQFEPNMIHYNELFLTGNSGYTYSQYSTAFKIMTASKISLDMLVTHRFNLSKIHDAIKVWDDKENSMKIMLTR